MRRTIILKFVLLIAVVANAISLKWSPLKEMSTKDHSLDHDTNREWEGFKLTHRRDFKENEHEKGRKVIFAQNLRTIQQHNLDYSKGLTSFKMAVNQFADMTSEEFQGVMLSRTGVNESRHKGASSFMAPFNYGTLPLEVDWRKDGYVTPVKNQGHCGSCWAFSATGAIEGQHFRKTGKLVSLSEQNLIDCSTPWGNSGCDGGLMEQAFAYVKENDGIDTEESYPYLARDSDCIFQNNSIGATVSGLVTLDPCEHKLKEAVATVGPVSVAIDAGVDSFRFYSSGIYDEPRCNSNKLNHGVLVVGYGSEDGQDYWLVKNSWGEKWGMKGYVKLARGKNNQCGIASAASYPLV